MNRQRAIHILRHWRGKSMADVAEATVFLLRATMVETRDVRATQRRKDRRRK